MKNYFLALALTCFTVTPCSAQWKITDVESTPMEQQTSKDAVDFWLECTIRNDSNKTLFVQGISPDWFMVESFVRNRNETAWLRQNIGVDRILEMLPVAAGADFKIRRRESTETIGDSMLLTFLTSHSREDGGSRILLGPFQVPEFGQVGSTTQPTAPERFAQPVGLSGFDEFVDRVLKHWQVPGVAVAIIDDGQIILSKGYGHRDLENRLPVTSKTLFPIASITKPFTSTAAAILVDEGKLNWDDRVREHLRAFQLFDADATEHLSIRDCLSHRTGMPYGPFHWYGINGWPEENMSPEIAYRKLRYFEPARSFRTAYEYSNSGYFIAGQLIEKISGKSYAEFVQERVLNPLKMTRTNFSVEQLRADSDHALPYDRYEGKIIRREFFPGQVVGPAGGVNSCVEEMVQFLKLYLDFGSTDDHQVVSKRNVKELFTPEVVLPELNFYAATKGFQSMGWQVLMIDGEKWGRHTGSLPGFTSVASFCPKRQCGYVILTNLHARPTAELIESNIRNRLRRIAPKDQFEVFRNIEAKDLAAYEESRRARRPEKVTKTLPSHPLRDFVGTYELPGYGDFVVTLENGSLTWQTIGFRGTLQHYHYNVFDMIGDRDFNGAADSDVAKELITFHSGRDGKIDSLSYPTSTVASGRTFTKVLTNKRD